MNNDGTRIKYMVLGHHGGKKLCIVSMQTGSKRSHAIMSNNSVATFFLQLWLVRTEQEGQFMVLNRRGGGDWTQQKKFTLMDQDNKQTNTQVPILCPLF